MRRRRGPPGRERDRGNLGHIPAIALVLTALAAAWQVSPWLALAMVAGIAACMDWR